ncbi:hypothetical protein PsorP6_006023 [Peronosclerospora sorghi]|uniref:Uncharacterized protein n=1 Tax=Peronosclerospora sorghi TaxID=230839 RepID=A0ACC0W5F4_9STRA|nr:hypothetical protein PsorP6_006023 [Peronosclerospora sorghi]
MTRAVPTDSGGPQTFLHAMNWLREFIVGYAQVVAPLQEKLVSMISLRGRKKKQLSVLGRG